MYAVVISFLTAFALTYLAIPSIIGIARSKRLYDTPNERSSHTVSTPSLGGIGIFAGSIFAIVLWTPFEDFGNLQYILCAFIILFLIGAKDDIAPMSAGKKFFAQVLAASILIFKSDIQLLSFYGLFGIYDQLPDWLYVMVSLLTILLIINAFNLIDGIDGLAGSIGALIITTLGCWFYLVGRYELATVAFACTGAIVAFLKYNFTPARIFMGDTGSLLIGLVSAILLLKFIDLNHRLLVDHPLKFKAAPVVAMGVAILPLFDTLRVFVTRILRGHSPFHPDRRHIHHLLIDYGFSHVQASGLLFFVNIVFISLVISLHDLMEIHALLAIVLSLAVIMTYILHLSVVRKKTRQTPV